MSNNNQENIKIALYIAAGTIAAFIIAKTYKEFAKVLNSINPFADDDTDKAIQDQEAKTERLQYFNPEFIKGSPTGTALLTKAGAEAKARNIWDAIGFTYDEPLKIKAQFSTLSTKSQVSHLAKVFKEKFGKDLLGWLVNKMDTDEQQKILTQILARLDTLPDFFSPKVTPIVKKPSTPLLPKPQPIKKAVYNPLFTPGKI